MYGDGQMTGTVDSVLFKGMHYEVVVETVPGTEVTVYMRVIENNETASADGKEKISANDFFVDIDDVAALDDKEIIARADAQAWSTETDELLSISRLEYDVKQEVGEYPVTFYSQNGLSIQKTISVIDQKYVRNPKENVGIMAFNFFKTIDEITESQALDTDLKLWANAQAWKLSDESQSVETYVDYDFDPENIRLGTYSVTFSTMGREIKVRTTDLTSEGAEVGLVIDPSDIHVMHRM